jgi:prepilin-type N-terminal cleavage/methylation domain-containing protein
MMRLFPERRRNALNTQGFTLIELMIAVLVGAVVIMALYAMYSISVRSYRVQDQALEAMSQLRAGTTQLRADLRSAAFNAPSQSEKEPWVFVLGGASLYAVVVDVDPDVPVANIGENDNIVPQRITLTGDFDSHQLFQATMIAGQAVTLQWGPENGGKVDFDRIFVNSNQLRIETYGAARQEQYIPIVSANFNGGVNPTITVQDSVQNVNGFGSGSEVSVVSTIRYRLELDTRRNADSVKYDLIREKISPMGQAVKGSWLVVAEYVVDLQFFDLCFNESTPVVGTMEQLPIALVCYPTLEELSSSPHSLDNNSNNTAHQLRSVSVKLSTRTAFEDQDVSFASRDTINEPLRTYELDPSLAGAARVYEAPFTVFMTSIQARRQ